MKILLGLHTAKMFTVPVQTHPATDSLAFFKAGDNPYTLGRGPFTEMATPPEDGVAFYCNDFSLSDPKPWKIPAQVTELTDLGEASLPQEKIGIEWEPLAAGKFTAVFSKINEMIRQGVIEKSVPVATERGLITAGTPEALIGKLRKLGSPFFSYGWQTEGGGFCGASPELLFSLNDKELNTMALAGTAKADEKEVFTADAKEIREHKFVAQALVSKLADIGKVTRAKREIMQIGELVHFHTPIRVELANQHDINELIARLHPTPALGPLPRTPETLGLLYEWRESLDCPAHFGAPFGLLKNSTFTSAVAIRGLHWKDNNLAIPSGCGVIEASRLVNEWRELRLKRQAVKDSFSP